VRYCMPAHIYIKKKINYHTKTMLL
jgi:hypothetical protein